jgi:hypothetical protein
MGNVITSKINAIKYVILIKAEKRMPYGKLGVAREMYNVIAEVSHKLRSL